MIFSPVIVDDGRRLLISNLDLDYLAVNRGEELVADSRIPATGSKSNVVSSLAALEFFKFFDGKNAKGLKLATAARMSASFPFVSPAVNLPCDPPLRLVDAGYYDNFGVNLAAIWIGENLPKLQELGVSGIVLVQIRAFLGRSERMSPPQGAKPTLDLTRGFELFGSPIKAFDSGRFTGSVFRNDSELAALIESVNDKVKKKDFLTTIVLENSSMVKPVSKNAKQIWPGMDDETSDEGAISNTDVAMTWYVTENERAAMTVAIPSKEQSFAQSPRARLDSIQKLVARVNDAKDDARRVFLIKELERALNYERIEALKHWWKN